jgi:SpoVK/Ycf46/Vps4 family AAA+-type ATPase
LIILLHGAPGVGKTSTAECVAESNNVPLLPITCGDLGITAQDVERKLEMNFRLAQAWGCVLLLDEADVFLAQRSSSDLERNAVVSGLWSSPFLKALCNCFLVFLRVLEYYEGILFLTTNRVGAFDEAFKSFVFPTFRISRDDINIEHSRIHLSLFYPWLNAVQTIKIWDMHMRRIKERIKTIEIDKEQILAYASLHFDSQCRLTGGNTTSLSIFLKTN